MLLTLTTTHWPATDLGYLLHKHPDRLQAFPLSFGTAHVFYPEAGPARCTAALVLDIDPIALVRGRPGAGPEGGPLDHYVNDRPYAVSSFLSVALSRVFASALGGRAPQRPELAGQAIALEARLTPLRCRGGLDLVKALFEPLGYDVAATRLGEGAFFDLRLSGEIQLEQLLSHLYVLIPVLDDAKHYWIGDDEVEKLLRHGEGWLQQHPARDLIARRALKHRSELTRSALAQLEAADDSLPEAEAEAADAADAPVAAAPLAADMPLVADTPADPKTRLHDTRLDRVLQVLKAAAAKNVLDLGCGEGKLLRRLAADRQFERIVGLDVSSRALTIAAARLHLDERRDSDRISLLQGSLTYRDRRLQGFDAAAVVEVVEHLDSTRLGALADALFGFARPRLVALTTPNADYNIRYPALAGGGVRHGDHRFEWSRAEFAAWAEDVAARFAYRLQIDFIGEPDPDLGSPTQMALFTC